jgi:hypothetical protein
LTLKFKARATDGYAVSVEAVGRRKVIVTVSKGGFFATYTVNGHVSHDRIQADLGGFGRIAVRFQGRRLRVGENPLPHRRCNGREPIKEVGRFVGTIRFKGERGFAELDATRAHGSLKQSFKRTCTRDLQFRNARPGSRTGQEKEEEDVLTILAAGSKSAGRHVSFEAVGSEAGIGEQPAEARENFAIAVAKLNEKVGQVSISRALLVFAGGDGFAVSQAGAFPTTASVALPKPFEGAADYLEEPGTVPSWTGSLRVHLPGVGSIPLAGPDFEAILCRVKNPRKDRCLRKAEMTLGNSPARLV